MLTAVLKIFNATKKNVLLISCYHSFRVKMPSTPNKIYLRCNSNSEQFQVDFIYYNEEPKIYKKISCKRDLLDMVQTFLSRISIKINEPEKKKKGKNILEVSDHKIDVQLIQNGSNVDGNLSCKKVFFDEPCDSIVRIGDKDYSVVVNSPWILQLHLPKRIMNGFLVYPKKIEVAFGNKEEFIFRWYKVTNKDLESVKFLVGDGYFYLPTTDDINYKLKLTCTLKTNGITAGPEFESISPCHVTVGPENCPFEKRHEYTQETLSNNWSDGQLHHLYHKLSSQDYVFYQYTRIVVTYNILADMYAESAAGRSFLFKHCPPESLDIAYRKQLILKELTGYNADIICLQEVISDLFDRDLKCVLSLQGLEGIFCKKFGKVREGVAVFYKASRFRVIGDYSYTLGTEAKDLACFQEIWSVIVKNDKYTERFSGRNTVLQIVILENIDTGNKLLIANTHLYFHPEADHIRLLQGGMAIYIISDLVDRIRTSHPNGKTSVIFCGDFNSTPDCGIYELFTKNEVTADHKDWASSNADELLTDLTLKHPLSLCSAYGTPEFTNYTLGFKGCLDYIFYDKKNLDIEQIVPLIPLEAFEEYEALPNDVIPSDHLALIADFSWK